MPSAIEDGIGSDTLEEEFMQLHAEQKDAPAKETPAILPESTQHYQGSRSP